jgi:hypothetical protein
MTIENLQASLPRLDERSRYFASSLIAQSATRHGLSPKQRDWVDRLVERANAPERPTTCISVSDIVALLDRAHERLKRPVILVRGPDGDLRLALAGAQVRVPGSVNVTSVGRGDWYGRVTRDGNFEPCRRYDDATIAAVVRGLIAMANDPVGSVAAYGHLTGSCCFCGREHVGRLRAGVRRSLRAAVGWGGWHLNRRETACRSGERGSTTGVLG